MQRIPLSKETARQRLLWCQDWKYDLEELMEVLDAEVGMFVSIWTKFTDL
jgi:hypothetical protein